MEKRHCVALSLALLLSRLVAGAAAASVTSVPASDWSALNQTVGGNLFVGTPAGLPCYISYNNGTQTSPHAPDPGECVDVLTNQDSSTWVADTFGSYNNVQYGNCMSQNQSCGTDALATIGFQPLVGTCYQGSVPSYYIDARGVSDIQAGLAFAQQQNVSLVVKNSGHDYKGRSSGADSLAIWTHNIQPPIALDKSFVPDGCQDDTGPVLTYGAGQGFDGIYSYAHQQGYMVVGGTSPTVGASGGWLTGAGHSALSTTLGLGVDNAIQIKAVLPNGTYITANRCQNHDMFYALRGGGGNAFGVITETTSRVYPESPLQMVFIAGISLGVNGSQQIRDIVIENTPLWASQGWGGYMAPEGPALFMYLITPKLTLDEATESMKPVTDFLASIGNGSLPLSLEIKTVASYYEFYEDIISQLIGSMNGNGIVMSSRLVPKTLFEPAEQPKLSNALQQSVDGILTNRTFPYGILLVPPSNYSLPESDQPGGPGEASITPAWRESYWHIIFQGSFDPSDPTKGGYGSYEGVYEAATRSASFLRDITPGWGSYQNEGDTFEPDYITSFWGQENYQRLLKIKQEIDPQNVLTCHQCVGWDSSDPRWGCYPSMPTP